MRPSSLTEPVTISKPITADELADVKSLFEVYMTSLGIDLGFQNVAEELRNFPQGYKALLQARRGTEIVGAVALKHFDDVCCEMKRLYCLPSARGLGLGRRLANEIIDAARRQGYRTMRLDTFESMGSAVALYERIGFVRIAPYYHNPNENVLYFEKDLTNLA